MVLEAASKDRHICTPEEWQRTYRPAIISQVSSVRSLIEKVGGRNVSQPGMNAPTPANAPSPMVNNPAGIPISLGKHQLKQEDLRIPESKRRRSAAAGGSASPASVTEGATVPPMAQTPITMGTPTSYPASTPVVTKRPSESPAAQGLAAKVQIGPSGPTAPRDKAQEEALARRMAREKAEEQEREEARKNPLAYAKNAMFKAMGVKMEDMKINTELPPPKLVGLADQVKEPEIAVDAASEKMSEEPLLNGVSAKEKLTPGQKAQLPSPPWSGTITPRQLKETFASVTDIEFQLSSAYGHDQPLNPEDFMADLFGDIQEKDEKDESQEEAMMDDAGEMELDFLLPLDGESSFDEGYEWTRGLHIPFNGEIGNIFEQSNQLGIVA
jgi:hypothetical protein